MKRVLLCAVALLLTLAATQSRPASACYINFCASCQTNCAAQGKYSICHICICQCVDPD